MIQRAQTINVILIEYKTSGKRFLDALQSVPELVECSKRLKPVLSRYDIHPRAKVYLEDEHVAPTLAILESEGVYLVNLRAGDSSHLFLQDLRHRHVLVSAKYEQDVLNAVDGIPRRHQVIEKARGSLDVIVSGGSQTSQEEVVVNEDVQDACPQS